MPAQAHLNTYIPPADTDVGFSVSFSPVSKIRQLVITRQLRCFDFLFGAAPELPCPQPSVGYNMTSFLLTKSRPFELRHVQKQERKVHSDVLLPPRLSVHPSPYRSPLCCVKGNTAPLDYPGDISCQYTEDPHPCDSCIVFQCAMNLGLSQSLLQLVISFIPTQIAL